MHNKKGQNTAEYAILIALIIGGAIAMQTYVKRGFQGGVKYGVDKLQANITGHTAQYEPYYLVTKTASSQEGYVDSEKTLDGGVINRTIQDRNSTSGQYQRFEGTETYNASEKGAAAE